MQCFSNNGLWGWGNPQGNYWQWPASVFDVISLVTRFPQQGLKASKTHGKLMREYIIHASLQKKKQLPCIYIRPHLHVEQINNFPFLTKFHLLSGEIQSHRHANKLDLWIVALGKGNRNTKMTWMVQWEKKNIVYATHIVCRHCIAHKISFRAIDAEFWSIFPRSPAFYVVSLSLLLAVVSSHLPQHISLLHSAKPIRDLRCLSSNQLPSKSLHRPLIRNHLSNQCRWLGAGTPVS